MLEEALKITWFQQPSIRRYLDVMNYNYIISLVTIPTEESNQDNTFYLGSVVKTSNV